MTFTLSTNSQSPAPNQRVALVTDWITKTGGGEKVVEAFHKLYPEAHIYTSYCSDVWRKRLDGKVITGYLQNWPFAQLRRFLPVLRQWWFTQLDLSAYDTIISISGNGEAKFVRKDHVSFKTRLLRLLQLSPSPISQSPTPTHICYCHTPVHFYWAQYDEYLKNPSLRPKWLARLGLRLLVKPLRRRDYRAAQAVDAFMANSSAIQSDIAKYYDRDSTVVHPPIDTEQFVQIRTRGETSICSKPHCIWWGRIVPAKRLDVAIGAANELALPLTIIGDGPDLARLKALAGPTVEFTGYISDEERNQHIASADLFVFPSREDFGVAPVEALAAGLPVVAYQDGGALDYIVEGENGAFFAKQNAESLVSTLRSLDGKTYISEHVAKHAQNFSEPAFFDHVRDFVEKHSGDKT